MSVSTELERVVTSFTLFPTDREELERSKRVSLTGRVQVTVQSGDLVRLAGSGAHVLARVTQVTLHGDSEGRGDVTAELIRELTPEEIESLKRDRR